MIRIPHGLIAVFGTALLLSGCATVAPPPSQWPYPQPPTAPTPADPVADGGVQAGAAIPPPVAPADPVPAPEVKPPLLPSYPKNIDASGSAAPVVSLVKKARVSQKAGRADEAAASLERALRIEPRNPWVWQALAGLHLTQKLTEQAESEARKSNSLARRNPYIEVENWRVIAAARNAAGDTGGMLQAQLRYEELQRVLAPAPPLKVPGAGE